MNSIILNHCYVMIDCFLSMKYHSLVVILNNRDNIFKRTQISVTDMEYFWNGTPLQFMTPPINDFVHPDKHNRKTGEFKNNFHIDVLYHPNIERREKNILTVRIHQHEYSFNIHPPCTDYLYSKCMTTIFKDEAHLVPHWVNYHKKLGFNNFILYDNSRVPMESNEVTIVHAPWPYWDYDSFQNRSTIGQVIQQNHCLWKYCPEFLALTDLDEYINPHEFNLFDASRSVLAIPNYFFSESVPFALEKSFCREHKKEDDFHLSYDKCIVHSSTVDLVCVHIPISFKNVYYAKYAEVQLNHYKKNRPYTVVDTSILFNAHQDEFDVVVPVGPNDAPVIHKQIEYTKKNVVGYRHIYLISSDPTLRVEGCTTIPETVFPFHMDTIVEHHGKLERNGWYLQQLLKLYAGRVLGLDRYLVIDADTFFLRPTHFVEDGKCMYNFGVEFHRPYFEHMKRLDATFTKVLSVSGITHHMMFETKYVNEMFARIETLHRDTFYHLFLKNVTDVVGAGASEYEMYFNYMLQHHKDDILVRPLDWKNSATLVDANLDYISVHWYLR